MLSIVYRIEHRDTGKGPYRWGLGVVTRMLDRHDDDGKHPTMSRDLGMNGWDWLAIHNPESLFGFTSLAQLNAWFTPAEQLVMLANGFVIRRRRGTLCHVTSSQCTFLPKKENS